MHNDGDAPETDATQGDMSDVNESETTPNGAAEAEGTTVETVVTEVQASDETAVEVLADDAEAEAEVVEASEVEPAQVDVEADDAAIAEPAGVDVAAETNGVEIEVPELSEPTGVVDAVEVEAAAAVDVDASVSDESDEPYELTAEEIAGWDLAKAALLEITPADTIGDPSDEVDEGDGVVSYLFENTMNGYPGWKWTVTVAQVEGSEPTVLETELTPAEGALLAPDWIPWSERMDDYRAAQIALGDVEEDDVDDDDADDEDSDESDEDESDDESDDDESDDDDDDDDDDDESDDEDDEDDDIAFDRPVLHSGDLDGVDIDELDVSDVADTGDESDDSEAVASAGPDIVDEIVIDEIVVTAVAEPVVAAEPVVVAAPVVVTVTALDDDEDERYAEPVQAPVRGVRRSRRATTATVFATPAATETSENPTAD